MKYAFIERHRTERPVSVQCAVLGVSVNGYRKYLRRQKPSNALSGNGRRVNGMALLAHIRAIHGETRGAYGWLSWSPLSGQFAKLGSPIQKDEPDGGTTEAVFSGF